MSDAPIGVFDSGVGGLTVLRALRAELPRESFVYLGDTARLPYGTKSPETVRRYALRATGRLIDLGVKAVVVACNTASAVGLEVLQELGGDVPVIGVIEPGAAAACAATRTGHIAVIATEGTVRGGAYQHAILRRRPEARVSSLATQLFVALAEEGLNEGPIAEAVARHYLAPLFGAAGGPPASAAPDALVLGCTHFPVLEGAIRAAVPAGVHIVDSAATTARVVRESLEGEGLLCTSGRSGVRFLATDSPERFARVGSRFLGRPVNLEHVELADL